MRYHVFWGALLTWCIGSISPAFSEQEPTGKLTLRQAVMCEALEDSQPKNSAAVFSVSLGRVFCFTRFDPVPSGTYAYHSWYYKDRLIIRQKLFLRPPEGFAFSSMQLRGYDKGPWRVEITNPSNEIIYVLRFSITD